MTDRYLDFVNSPVGKTVTGWFGLPSPRPLNRTMPSSGDPLEGTVLIETAANGTALAELIHVFDGSTVRLGVIHHGRADKANATNAQLHRAIPETDDEHFGALVFDATGLSDAHQLRAVFDFFQPVLSKLSPNGRVLILGRTPTETDTPLAAAAQYALDGFIRSVAKEIGKKGSTANLIYLDKGAEPGMATCLRYFLSPRSAFVSGQSVRLNKTSKTKAASATKPLAGKVALVTGASRGIGEKIAESLARDGAHIIGVDLPALSDALQAVMSPFSGQCLTLDITSEGAAAAICAAALAHGGLDIIVHNAGVTRDKTLARMSGNFWDQVIAVNLLAEETINTALLDANLVKADGRLIGISSISGVAGNYGQSNYAAAKSGVIGYVQALAPQLPKHITINAIAPGFIETAMTAAIPFAMREAGRRLNALSQGGLPEDVAEAVCFLAQPGARAINGQVLRVCGQNLIGR